MITVKPLGAWEVILQFQNRDEMQDILNYGKDFLLQQNFAVEPCTSTTCSKSHLLRVKKFNVPFKGWSYEFLEALTASLGQLIFCDGSTRDGSRFDVVWVLLEVTKPWTVGKELCVQIDNALT